jgi:hypothetical protein
MTEPKGVGGLSPAEIEAEVYKTSKQMREHLRILCELAATVANYGYEVNVDIDKSSFETIGSKLPFVMFKHKLQISKILIREF